MNTLHIPTIPKSYERVSVCGVACIIIDDKYLLLRNKRSLADGKTVHTAIGGALQFESKKYDRFRDHFRVHFHYDKDGYGTFDLRLFMSPSRIPSFLDWVKLGQDREVNCLRELREELVDEEGLLTDADIKNGIVDISPAGAYLIPVQTKAGRGHDREHRTHYVFCVEHVCLSDELESKIRGLLAQGDNRLVLKTRKDIESERVHINHSLVRFTDPGIAFGEYAKSLDLA